MFSSNQSSRSPAPLRSGVPRPRLRRMGLWATAVAVVALGLSAPANADDGDVVAPSIIVGDTITTEVTPAGPGAPVIQGSTPLPAGTIRDSDAPPVKIEREPRPPTLTATMNGGVDVRWRDGVTEAERYRTTYGKWVVIDDRQRIWVFDPVTRSTEQVSVRPPRNGAVANSPTHAQPSTCAYGLFGCG